MKDRLNPLNDYMFLKVMGEKGDEEQLCAFLNAVLGRKGKDAIESVEIIENKTVTAEVIGEASLMPVPGPPGETGLISRYSCATWGTWIGGVSFTGAASFREGWKLSRTTGTRLT
jgi:hypothetical protein